MAAVPYINDAQFDSEVLKSEVPVLLDFTAAWCGPCKAIAPLLDQVSAERGGAVKVVKMDIDANPMTPGKFGITSIPTLMMFKNGQLVQRHVGSLNKAALDQFVGKGIA